MGIRIVAVQTKSDGTFTYERPLKATIKAIEVQLGDMDTPDIAISDGVYETSILDVSAVAADAVYRPGALLQADDGTDLEVDTGVKAGAEAAVMGTLKVEVSGAGNLRHGRIYVLFGP